MRHLKCQTLPASLLTNSFPWCDIPVVRAPALNAISQPSLIKFHLSNGVPLQIRKTNSRSGMVASRQPFWTTIPTPTRTVAGLIFKYDRQRALSYGFYNLISGEQCSSGRLCLYASWKRSPFMTHLYKNSLSFMLVSVIETLREGQGNMTENTRTTFNSMMG